MAERETYRSVVGVLLALAALGSVGLAMGGIVLANAVLVDAAVTLGLFAGMLVGVMLTQLTRLKPLESSVVLVPAEETSADPTPVHVEGRSLASRLDAITRWRSVAGRAAAWLPDARERANSRFATAAAGLGATLFIRMIGPTQPATLTFTTAGVAVLILAAGAGLTAVVVRYLTGLSATALPEAEGLSRASRIAGWVLAGAGLTAIFQWLSLDPAVRIVDFAVIAINLSICYGLLAYQRAEDGTPDTGSMDLGALSVLGSRTNIFGSLLDAAQSQLGIDLRSSWALEIVRRGIEPLIIGLAFLGWLSTSVTVVGIEERGLVERLGKPLSGAPLSPGLHVHLPWPFDRVTRLPVARAQMVSVGHEGQEEGGPENVLWAVEHAANEYTLLLGNGRDLITVDAGVQYRIRDPHAWFYSSQNPADALRAIAYRAVMRTTVDRTLADALSENLVTTTTRMRQMVQQDADALNLGVEVLGFTVGGMHPPVAVATDYQSVVSAELGKVTAVVNAQVLRNRTVPYAESAAYVGANTALAEGAQALATAAGEAWSFLTLQSQYRADPGEYMFRRRLETLEKGLTGRRFTSRRLPVPARWR